MKRNPLIFALILQIIVGGSVFAVTSTGSSLEYIPASKNLGIGTTNPVAKLDVNGQILIRGANPGAGKFLQSDRNGKASWVSQSILSIADASTLGNIDSSQFLRSDTTNKFASGTLITDSGTRFDVNGDLSIAATNIVLDGANTSFTQSTGNISLVPASAKDLTTTITSAGEFKINTSDFVFNGTNARIGIGTANPSTKLEVNGTIKGNLINGTSANFTNLSTSSFVNSGTTNFNKVIVTNNVNGATANFPTANFTNVVVSGIVNGSTTSFDGDFTNGSVLFSNNQGVISQDNSHFYWNHSNGRLAINHHSPDMALDLNGAVVIRKMASGASFGSETNASNGANAMSLYINKPSSTAQNDLLIMAVSSVYPVSTPPSGWTLIEQVDPPGGNPESLTVYYKIATNSEPANYGLTFSSSTQSRGVILRYTNVETSSPIDSHGLYYDWSSGNAVTPSVVTGHANTKIVRILALAVMNNTFDPVPGHNLQYKYETSPSDANLIVVDTDQSVAGAAGTVNITYTGMSMVYYSAVTLAINSSGYAGASASDVPDPDTGASFIWMANSHSYGNNGDLMAKITANSTTKTIRIIDFKNGNLAATSDADSLDGIDSSSFLLSNASDNYSSGTLTFDPSTTLVMAAGSSLDINSTNLSIADTDINLDGANTAFTQSSGNISLIPASAKDLTTTIASAGEFKINSSDFVFNGTNARVGIGTANPSTKLDVNGTLKGIAVNGTNANFTGTVNVGKLISSGVVNGLAANFTNVNWGVMNVGKLISSGVVNGTTANFTNLSASNLNLSSTTVNTFTSTTINNSGTVSTAKLIASGAINGTTANLSKVLASGSVNGTNANFTSVTLSGIVNGSVSSFDGNFTNGSVLFSNNQGVISEDNSHLYWDRVNNNLAIGSNAPNGKLTISGPLALQEGGAASASSSFGKWYVNATDSDLYFVNDNGNFNVLDSISGAAPNASGVDTNFQFNNSGAMSGNGALSFIRSTKSLQIPANAPFTINSTNLSIADNNIAFDSPSGVIFTPTPGQGLNISLSGAGDFAVNSNQLYLDSSAAKLGILTNNPNELLTINGNLAIKESSVPSLTDNFGKLYINSSDSKLYFKDSSGIESNLINPTVTTAIDDLSDASNYYTDSSLYIGNGSGLNHSAVTDNNISLGINSLRLNSAGTSNNALGYGTLYHNSNGSGHALGSLALYNNTNGDSNVALGVLSLEHNIDGDDNYAIGFTALNSNINGNKNMGLGYQALYSNTNGDSNIALGSQALVNNISGNGNIAIGYRANGANRSGNYNTVIGYYSSGANESYTTAFGYQALTGLHHGTSNTAFGPGAISSMSNGDYNIALGVNAGKRAAGFGGNYYASNGIYIGYNTGFYDGGDNNIFIGHNAGNGTTTGSSNILIGYNNMSLPSISASNQLDIGDTIYGDLANHNVGIGTASIDTKLEVNGTAMTNTLVNKAFYSNSSGANVTINWNNGNKQKITLGHNVTFSFTAPTIGVGSFTLMLIQDGTGTRSVTWPASVYWPNSTPPTLSTAPGYIDLVSCIMYTSSNYFCQMALDFR